MTRQPGRAALLAVSAAAVLGLVAAGCSDDDKKVQAASSDETTTTAPAGGDGTDDSSTTLTPASGPSTSTTKKPAATSSTIAYFTLPPSTTAPPPDGGGYEPGEAVGRTFVDAVMDGKRANAAPLAGKAVLDKFEPWKPYARSNDQGVPVPDYRYTGSPRKGTFNATLQPTVFVHCTVDTGKVTACSFGE